MRLGILLSGRGSNFEAIAHNVRNELLPCEIGFVFSNRPQAPGLALAREYNLPHGTILSLGVERASFDLQVIELLKLHRVDIVCLAGYMRLLTGEFVRQFPIGSSTSIRPCCPPSPGWTLNIRP